MLPAATAIRGLVANEIRITRSRFGATALLDVDGALTLQGRADLSINANDGSDQDARENPGIVQRCAIRAVVGRQQPHSCRPGSIDIYGSMRVPFGSLTLKATREITLRTGATVSVSGEGLTGALRHAVER